MEFVGYKEPQLLYRSEGDSARATRYTPMFQSALELQHQASLPVVAAASAPAPQPSSLGCAILPVSSPSIVSNELLALPPTPAHRQIPRSPPSSQPRQFHLIEGLLVPPLFSSPDDPVDYSLLTPTAVLVCRTSVVNSRSNEQVTYMRKKVAEYSGGLSHIELAFKLDTGDGRRPQYWSCSSRQDKVVEFLERDILGNAYNHTKGEWRCDELTLTETQRRRAWVYSQSQCGKPYNKWALYAFLPEVRAPWWLCGLTCFSPRCFFECCCSSVYDGSSLMCSQLVMDTLAFTFQGNDEVRYKLATRVPSHMVNPGSALQCVMEMGLMSQVVTSMVDSRDIQEALRKEFGTEVATYALPSLARPKKV